MTDELKTWAEEQAYERAKAEYMEKLNEIKAEIKQLPYQRIFGHVSSYSLLDTVIEIIDKYRDKEQEDNGFFDEITDDESDGEVYEKIKEIIGKVKEQET